MNGYFQNKRFLLTGIASKRSIAYAIAQRLLQQGAKLMVSCQNERLLEKTRQWLGDEVLATAADLTNGHEMQNLLKLAQAQDEFAGVLHSAAFARHSELEGSLLDSCSQEGFLEAQNASVYSFIHLAKLAKVLMPKGGSLVTLSFIGAERAFPHYNVMGPCKAALEASVRYLAQDMGQQHIRVNCVSAGPIRTVASSAIPGFHAMLNHVADTAPLPGNLSQEEVADCVLFLLSPWSRAVSGQVLYADHGFHAMGGCQIPKNIP